MRLHFSKTAAPSVHVHRWGDPDASVLLIHGFGDSSSVWEEFARRFAATAGSVAIDLRGHGDSAWAPSGEYTLEMFQEDGLEALDSLQSARVVAIGHSLGAAVALHLAAQRPQRVIAVAIVDFGPGANQPSIEFMRSQFARRFQKFTSVLAYREFLAAQLPLVAPAILHRIAMRNLGRLPTGGWTPKGDPRLVGYRPHLDEPAVWELLRQSSCPLLAMRGQYSALFSKAAAENLIRVRANSTLQTIAGAGHGVMLDNPDAFYVAASGFVESSLGIRSIG